jgi:DNA-binding transcriptional regulator YdaS (Cro superfamily)
MSPKQFQTAIDRLGIPQTGWARLTERDPRTVRKWVAGTNRIPPEAAILLRAMLEGKLTQEDVERLRK